ncbi:hypothetical protein R6Q59_033203 [Mikania micrantha]|uniref:Uncharacterized protein n=1 Tax=Mikania micrantha TaxID=192012 RepID=A0A5N6NT82_9ASTR|nr:hypothetical protein E3N88_17852 [Mikania micrantha]
MALDNETKSPATETQKKKPTDVSAIEVDEDIENTKPGKEPHDEKSIEKTDEQKIIVPMEEMNLQDVEPIVTEKTIPETMITTEASESKEEIGETTARIIAKNMDEIIVVNEADSDVENKIQEEPNHVTDDKKEEIDPIVYEKQSVPMDEIAMKQQDVEMKDEQSNVEPLKINEKDAENDKQVKTTVEALESKENKTMHEENEKETTNVEKPSLEHVKIESKEEEKASATPKQSISLMGKVKKSFMKAKKAMSGKNNNTPETKEDEKA